MEIRRLNSDDIFLVTPIISAIGIEDFKKCFSSPEVVNALKADGGKGDVGNKIGLMIAIDIAAVILRNIPKCKPELYAFVASVTNSDVQTIIDLSPAKFARLVIDLFKHEDIADFISVVSELFK